MTSFSDICIEIDRLVAQEDGCYMDVGLLEDLRDYIIMVRDAVFPNILLACPDNKAVRAIMRDALKQLEDM